MNKRQFEKILNHIINCIEDAGYDAENQIILKKRNLPFAQIDISLQS